MLEGCSDSRGKAAAYLPVIDLLKGYFEILPGDDERKQREKIAGKIVMLDRALDSAPVRISNSASYAIGQQL